MQRNDSSLCIKIAVYSPLCNALSEDFTVAQKAWHDTALRELKTSSLFKDASEKGRLLESLFFGTIEAGKGSIGMYIELYHIANTIRAVALVFVAPQNAMYTSMYGAVSESEVPVQGSFVTKIQCDVLNAFEVSADVAQDFSKLGEWNILSASAKLDKKVPKFSGCDLNPCSWRDQSQNLWISSRYDPKILLVSNHAILPSNAFVQQRVSDDIYMINFPSVLTGYCICPNCFGRGSITTMAIPKKYYDAGFTGYALYTCNEINGKVACKICNGDGEEYLPWYQKENPDKISRDFVSGNGVIEFNTIPA